MARERVRIAEGALRGYVTQMYVALGAPATDAATIADVLVWANLRGVDSHGVSRIPRYVELYEKGEAKAHPSMRTERPRPAVAIVHADGAAGPVAMSHAMEQAIEMARETGVGWAAVDGTVHTGAVGYYTSQASSAGMLGIAIVAGVPNMAYHGSRAAGVATSPLSIAVPAGRHADVVLDMATAIIALGKIAQYKASGQPLPEGFALTKGGEPTTDPAEAAIPLPLGGAKGSAMSLVFELITSALVANPIVSSFHSGDPEGRKHRQNGVLIAVDVSAFLPLDEFTAIVDETLDAIKGLPAADGTESVVYPGERSAATFETRRRDGIPIPKKIWDALATDAEKLGVQVPEPLAVEAF
jgi:LDH2 family malate/lactate/ureidoglycolate dehydrogenase